MGIIDILMLYTRRKKMERVWKTMTGGVSLCVVRIVYLCSVIDACAMIIDIVK